MMGDLHQEIYLEPLPDGESYAISGSDVQVHTCRVYERTRDSSKVRSRAFIDYRWETKVYDGRLVAVHKDGTYLAYVLHNRHACNVRVINRSTRARALIKNFVGQAIDLVWSFTSWPLLLAISDEGGNVYVYTVEDNGSPNEINLIKYLKVESSTSVAPRQPPHRLAWCPFVPDQPNSGDDESDRALSDDPLSDGADDQSRLLAVFHGSKVEILNIEKIAKKFGSETTFVAIDCAISSKDIESEISAVAIAPDATALALSSQGGEVKFYILGEGRDVSHAQSWKPHKGRPVTSIVFLDNFLAAGQQEVTFWRYLLTTCDGNRELKVWNCENWECMGTLRIDPPEAQSEHVPLTLAADWTSTYIFLSDIERKSLYTVEIVPSDGRVRFASFTEFPLLHPALSLAVINAGPKRFRPTSPGASGELEDGGENEFVNMIGVQAFLYAVNPKSILELDIRFVPPRRDDVNESMLSTVSSCKLEAIHDELSDLSVDLLRVAPSASDLAKTAGTDFMNFNVGRRRSTPTHLGSPNDRTPTSELDVNRRISASPSSQEVSKILANPLTGGASADDDASILLDTNNVLLDEEQPTTPTTQSHLGLSTASAVTMPSWHQPNALGQHPNAMAALAPDYVVLTEVLASLSADLTRTNLSIARQEESLQKLKNLVATQQSMWNDVLNLVQDKERQGIENIQLLHQSVDALQPEQFRQNLIRTMEEVVQKGLDTTLRAEMRNVVVPCLTETFKPLKDTVQMEVAQKLTATDAIVRESIGKMVKSQPVLDAIGQAVASAVTNQANAAYRESFQKFIAPSFDNIARSLFTQMNDAFQHGTKEFADQLQRQSMVIQNNTEEWKKGLSSQFVAFADQIKVAHERHLVGVQGNMDKHFESLTKRLQESLFANVRAVVKEEVAKAMADGQQALNETVMRVLRSQAPTPVPMMAQQAVDRQQILSEITQYLKSGQFNTAFQHALQARDTNFVNYVIEKIDPTRLFSESPCPLQQPVIVSLLHQLAADLMTNTDLKLRYMQEAIPSLDLKMTGDMGVNTFRQVSDKLNQFLQANPVGPHARRGKTVLMLLSSLIA